jgi:hypothetical protein
MVHDFTEEKVDCMTLVVLDVFEALHVVSVRSKARTVDATHEYLTADPKITSYTSLINNDYSYSSRIPLHNHHHYPLAFNP